jgi:hypothetical protein
MPQPNHAHARKGFDDPVTSHASAAEPRHVGRGVGSARVAGPMQDPQPRRLDLCLSARRIGFRVA